MGASAAAIIIRKEKDLVEHFRDRGATTAARAVTPAALGVEIGMIWRRLEERAVIRQAESGRFYLDEPSWGALRATRQRLMLVMVLLVIIGGIGLYFTSRAS